MVHLNIIIQHRHQSKKKKMEPPQCLTMSLSCSLDSVAGTCSTIHVSRAVYLKNLSDFACLSYEQHFVKLNFPKLPIFWSEWKTCIITHLFLLTQLRPLTFSIPDRFPLLNSLIQRINLRKRRDSLIIGGVIAVCIVLLLWYAFRWIWTWDIAIEIMKYHHAIDCWDVDVHKAYFYMVLDSISLILI